MITEFYIDILDSAGNRLGDGPLLNLIQLDDTTSLDTIGSCEFVMPATDERTQYITAGSQFDIFDRVDGYLGRYYYRSKTLSVTAQGEQRLTVRCHDQLIELTRQSVYFRRTYTNAAVNTVITDLVAMAAGWSSFTEVGIGNTSVMYEGESVLRAVDVLRDRWNRHFRLGGPRLLQFGAFGNDLGFVLSNLRGQVQADIDRNPDIALIERLQLLEESDEIFNCIVPLGAGQGVSQLTIQEATAGTYTVQVGTNQDGSLFYYIEDAASVLQYGRRQRVLSFPNIRPITNSEANIENAANALKLTAEAYMARHLAPNVTFAVPVRALRRVLSVGDLVRLQYRDIVDNYGFVDVNDNFYVMGVTRSRSSDGTRSAELTIATIAERRTSDTDIVLEIINDVRALKVNIPITLAYSPVGPYTQRVDPTHTATFTVRLGAEVTYLNYAIMRFKTSPLKSSVTSVSTQSSSVGTSGPSSKTTADSNTHTHSVTASGAHTHDVTIGASGSHSHTITVAANDVSSTGSSSSATTDADFGHVHFFTIFHDGTPNGSPVYFDNVTDVELEANFSDFNNHSVQTDAGGATHTHDNPHTHGISHGHSGSTTNSPTHTHSATGGAASNTHDHSIGASGSHDHGMAHTHDITIPSHNHSLSYGLFEDTAYPRTISVAINGVDVTAALGGPWRVGDNNPFEGEFEITDYLVNAIGGLRQNHLVVFSCAFGQGEIEFECDMLCSIQAIAVS